METSKIDVSDYNDQWPVMFEEEKHRLFEVVGAYLKGSIEHVGSTAVVGLMAKPVIDIMFGVKSLQASVGAIEKLKQYGYCYTPYKHDVMHWFCKPSEHIRTHHLHLVPFQSSLWRERIKFRDILRANPKVANQYQQLKLQLSRQYSNDREQYTAQKWPFIQKVLLAG